MLAAPAPLHSIDDYIAAGRVMQRFWLGATHLGWLIQPEMTPVIFARYYRRGLIYTAQPEAMSQTARLNQRLQNIVGASQIEKIFFIGRIGLGPPPLARSTRKPLEKLMMEELLKSPY